MPNSIVPHDHDGQVVTTCLSLDSWTLALLRFEDKYHHIIITRGISLYIRCIEQIIPMCLRGSWHVRIRCHISSKA